MGLRPVEVRGWRQWNSELGMRPPASPSCRLYEPEAIGAYAYPPACKPYGLYGLETAPAGKRKIKAKSIALKTPALLNNPYGPGKQMDCAIS